jgi:hypothetical protein
LRRALKPSDALWIDARDQTWVIKETATLVAMLAGFASLFPLALVLVRLPFFASIRRTDPDRISRERADVAPYPLVRNSDAHQLSDMRRGIAFEAGKPSFQALRAALAARSHRIA